MIPGMATPFASSAPGTLRAELGGRCERRHTGGRNCLALVAAHGQVPESGDGEQAYDFGVILAQPEPLWRAAAAISS